MKIKFKKLHSRAVAPIRLSDHAAGWDLHAADVVTENSTVNYYTGLALEIPIGHVGLVFMRSSISKHPLVLANAVAVIDSDFRGEIVLKFRRVIGGGEYYQPGHRIAQLIIIPIPEMDFIEVDELGKTSRAEGGFGSTGA